MDFKMDFEQLMEIAKQNKSTTKGQMKFYCTKFAPPKREAKKHKKLSDNIMKFLEKFELEKRQKAKEEKEKKDKLYAMRDERSKNKIKKMLKVIKSANKSVIEDAKCNETAVTVNGSEQPDEDDYGFASNEAATLFTKYCEEVNNVKNDKRFVVKSRPHSRDDLKGTRNRVKEALIKEQEKKDRRQRVRASHITTKTLQQKSESSVRQRVKELYNPKASEKVENVKDNEGFVKTRPQSTDDLGGTKNKVEQTLKREPEERLPGQRVRISHITTKTLQQKSESSAQRKAKELCNPKAEKETVEKRKREEEVKMEANVKNMKKKMKYT